MSNCLIRKAKRSDLRGIYLIEVKSFQQPYPLEYFLSLITLFPEYSLVLECDGKIAGYIIGSKKTDGSGHIMSVAVHPSYRNRGFGTSLIKKLEEIMSGNGIKRVFLEVSTNNGKAVRLYQRLGYRFLEIIRSYYPDGSDAYVMFKELTN